MKETKKCLICKIEKSIEDFNYCKPTYRQSYCRPCQSIRNKENYNRNAEKINEQKRLAWKEMPLEKKKKRNSFKKTVIVNCIDCESEIKKRHDSIKNWKGRCRSCAMIFLETLPERKEMKRNNGIEYIKKYGPPKGPKNENRGRGDTHWNWDGGKTPFRIKIWQSKEYKEWRMSVFERDNFKCVICKKNTHALQADHIKPFAIFIDERFSIENGRTMCIPCHRKYGARVLNGIVTRDAITTAQTG